MANAFQNVEGLARDASIMLRDELVTANLINRNVEQSFTDSTGGQVSVSYVPKGTAREQDHSSAPTSLTIDDISESKVTVDARNYIYHKRQLNTVEKTYEAGDFAEKVIRPSMIAIAEAADSYFMNTLARGFSQFSGTAGTEVAAASDIVAARKKLKDAGVPMSGLAGVIGTQAEANLLGLGEFINQDYGTNVGTAIQNAQLARRYDVDWFVSQNAGSAHAEGDTAGTVLVNNASAAIGDLTLPIDALTAATGTINKGTKFTVAGDSTQYVVTADATIATNAATLAIYPALVVAVADDAAVTFFGAFTQDVIFQPDATAGAIIAPAPLMHNSAVVPFEGLSVRVTTDSSTDSSSGAIDTILFDIYTGGEIVRPEGGVILQG